MAFFDFFAADAEGRGGGADEEREEGVADSVGGVLGGGGWRGSGGGRGSGGEDGGEEGKGKERGGGEERGGLGGRAYLEMM